ncbi:hypothetical protein L1887_42336 [Cichorium endivia]|nr:hypothetical protein L1887_42336 [Cichorium endivia]
MQMPATMSRRTKQDRTTSTTKKNHTSHKRHLSDHQVASIADRTRPKLNSHQLSQDHLAAHTITIPRIAASLCNTLELVAQQQEALVARFGAGVIHRELLYASIGLDGLPPIARSTGGTDVPLPEEAPLIIGDALCACVVVEQRLHDFGQSHPGCIAQDLAAVILHLGARLGTGVLGHKHNVLIGRFRVRIVQVRPVLDPPWLVRDDDRSTVLKVAQATAVGHAFGEGVELPLAVVCHRDETFAVAPVERLDVVPRMVLGGGEQGLAVGGADAHGAAPEELADLCAPGRGVFELERLFAVLGVGTDARLGPAVKAVVGHEPEVDEVGGAVERELAHATPVVGREAEFCVGQLLACAGDRLEEQRERRVDAGEGRLLKVLEVDAVVVDEHAGVRPDAVVAHLVEVLCGERMLGVVVYAAVDLLPEAGEEGVALVFGERQVLWVEGRVVVQIGASGAVEPAAEFVSVDVGDGGEAGFGGLGLAPRPRLGGDPAGIFARLCLPGGRSFRVGGSKAEEDEEGEEGGCDERPACACAAKAGGGGGGAGI